MKNGATLEGGAIFSLSFMFRKEIAPHFKCGAVPDLFTSRFSDAVNIIESVPSVCPSVCLSALSQLNNLISTYALRSVSRGLSITLKGLCVQRDYGLRTREVRQRWGVFILCLKRPHPCKWHQNSTSRGAILAPFFWVY